MSLQVRNRRKRVYLETLLAGARPVGEALLWVVDLQDAKRLPLT